MSMKTISQKKANFPTNNNFGYFFFRFTEYGRPQITNFQAPQRIMAIIVQVLGSFP